MIQHLRDIDLSFANEICADIEDSRRDYQYQGATLLDYAIYQDNLVFARALWNSGKSRCSGWVMYISIPRNHNGRLMFLNEIGTNLPADEFSDWGLMSEERKKRKEFAKRSCITAILCMKQYSKLREREKEREY